MFSLRPTSSRLRTICVLIGLVLLTACVPSRLGFGRPTAQTLEAFTQGILERAGGTITPCPTTLFEDSKFRHVCAKTVTPFERFRIVWETALEASIKDNDATLQVLYGGWREAERGVRVNFYAVNGRAFNIVYAPDAGVIVAIDQNAR